MPTIKIPVRIDYPNSGGPGYNVFHARVNDVETDLEDALDALESFYNTLPSLWGSTTSLTIGEGMINDPYGSPTYLPDDVRVITGTGTPTALPQLLAICISWRTPSATRTGRGRTFLGPLVTGTAQADGTPIDAIVTAVRDSAQFLVGQSTGANGWAFGVYSQKDALFRDWVGSSVKDRFSYLSSRRD